MIKQLWLGDLIDIFICSNIWDAWLINECFFLHGETNYQPGIVCGLPKMVDNDKLINQ